MLSFENFCRFFFLNKQSLFVKTAFSSRNEHLFSLAQLNNFQFVASSLKKDKRQKERRVWWFFPVDAASDFQRLNYHRFFNPYDWILPAVYFYVFVEFCQRLPQRIRYENRTGLWSTRYGFQWSLYPYSPNLLLRFWKSFHLIQSKLFYFSTTWVPKCFAQDFIKEVTINCSQQNDYLKENGTSHKKFLFKFLTVFYKLAKLKNSESANLLNINTFRRKKFERKIQFSSWSLLSFNGYRPEARGDGFKSRYRPYLYILVNAFLVFQFKKKTGFFDRS